MKLSLLFVLVNSAHWLLVFIFSRLLRALIGISTRGGMGYPFSPPCVGAALSSMGSLLGKLKRLVGWYLHRWCLLVILTYINVTLFSLGCLPSFSWSTSSFCWNALHNIQSICIYIYIYVYYTYIIIYMQIYYIYSSIFVVESLDSLDDVSMVCWFAASSYLVA